jgi:hypothetical protein
MAIQKKTSTAKKLLSQNRKKPGTGPDSDFYRIDVRPARTFVLFRTHDVGSKGGLERIAGKRASGTWDTQAWLVSKENAHVTRGGQLVIDDLEERDALKKAISGKIMQRASGLFTAKPVKNVPEAAKPTPAMKRAQRENIKKAQAARRT